MQQLANLLGDHGLDRDLARWEHCDGVCNALDDYRQSACSEMPYLLRQHTVVTLIDAMAAKDGAALATAFGNYRALVTSTEADNARKLGVLAGVSFELDALRIVAENKRPIDHALQKLSFTLRGAWRVELPETAHNIRLWATRATRRYDLLAREWREL